MEEPRLILATEPPPSPARTRPPQRPPLRIAAVQQRWHPDPAEHEEALATGVRIAGAEGARLVCLQELTLSRYFAVDPTGPEAAGVVPEELPGGATHLFAARLAQETGVAIHASLYERVEGGDGLGYNTAIVVTPDGELAGVTRKLHIPVTAGYHEDRYFRPGPAPEALPLVALGEARLGLPTCWDQWFPELARAYGLEGADVLVSPTAIGSEPPLEFYGSSFISDPYGRVLARAPRDEPAVLVADLDLDQRRDWLELFPLLATRRPDTYGLLAD